MPHVARLNRFIGLPLLLLGLCLVFTTSAIADEPKAEQARKLLAADGALDCKLGALVEINRVWAKAYAEQRTEGERFGDFVIRKGIVQEIKHGNEFKH